MSNINLRKDCEAFYTFDERSFDSQRNVIQDRSGYGRHAEARGGPTVGVNGPDGFGATSFDGSDDYFEIQPNIFRTLAPPFSIAVSVKQNDTSRNSSIGAYTGAQASAYGFTVHNSFGGTKVEFMVNSGDTSLRPAISHPTDEWKSAVCTYDGTEARVIGAEETSTESDAGDYQLPNTPSSTPVTMGATTADGHFHSGEIAYVGVWSRILSDAEIDYLNRLTGPRRANL